MTSLIEELEQQPEALRRLIDFYTTTEGNQILEAAPVGRQTVFTGMGSSYHAAWTAALHLQRLGIAAAHLEATDLLYYSHPSIKKDDLLVYISQSGSSAEVEPVLERVEGIRLLAITNQPDSPLARNAKITLPLLAGEEHLIASKTYLNTLAILWLLCRRIAGLPAAGELEALRVTADRVECILGERERQYALWSELLEGARNLVFLGHGPHAATARQAAMIVSEWTKLQTGYASTGGFRHGFIEASEKGLGAVLFASAGKSQESTLALGRELDGYGVRTLTIAQGRVYGAGEIPAGEEIDEFLSPCLDIVPVEAFADRKANESGSEPGFRRIGKVVRKY